MSVPPLAICDVNNDGILDGTSTPINRGGILDSDDLDSVEIGGKFSLLNNKLLLNTAIYRIDWDGIPIKVFSPCGSPTEWNAGKARSQGMEIEANYQLSEMLRLDIGVGYNEGELTEDSFDLGSKGDRLPYSPRNTANIAIDYAFDVAGYESFVYINYVYLGGFHDDLAQSSVEIGDYATLSLRAGINIKEWNVDFFVKNLTNEDEISASDSRVNGLIRLTPRQFGLDVGYRF